MTAPDDIIVEFVKIGNSVRVSAICTRTGREVSIVGDPKASKQQLENVAIAKLRYVMERDSGSNSTDPKKGLIV